MEKTIFSTPITLVQNPSEYAEAAITSNPLITWVKFPFTDDQPNANNQRVPKEEFANIIKTGIYMPVKVELGNPKGDHFGSVPIGTITNLVEQGNKVLGLAALWREEYEEDVQKIEEMFENGEDLTLSWELLYSTSSKDNDGVENLQGITVIGITFVGNPAYEGRTNVLSMAEATKENSTDADDESAQSSKDNKETSMEDIKKLEEALADAEDTIETLETEKENLSSELEELKELESEVEDLREYKEQREAEDANTEVLETRKEALTEAGIELTDEEFEARSEKILDMDEETFEFYLQDLVAFSKKESTSSVSTSTSEIPNVSPDNDSRTAHERLLDAIRAGELDKETN